MRVARGPVGNLDDHGLTAETADRVVIDGTQRRRSRFRTTTESGTELGVVVDGANVLATGDLLRTSDGTLLVVELEPREALAVSLPGSDDPRYAAAMVAMGHAVGNKHWPLVTEGGRIYVPTDGETEQRCEFLRTLLPEATTIAVEVVDPSLFDDGQGGGGGHSHSYPHDHGHDYVHDHEHDHSAVPLQRLRKQGETDDE